MIFQYHALVSWKGHAAASCFVRHACRAARSRESAQKHSPPHGDHFI